MRLRCNLVLLLSALGTLASAQPGPIPTVPEDRDSWVELQAASVFNSASSGLRDSQALGLAGGQWLDRNWGWELSALRGPLQDRAGLWESTVVHIHGSALFNPLPDLGNWRPFLRAGLGVSGGVYEAARAQPGTVPGLGLSPDQGATPNTTSTTTRFSLIAGAGLQATFGQHGFASLEARVLGIQVTPGGQRMESMLLAGVGYRWGQPQAAAAPTPPPPIQPEARPAPLPVPVPKPLPEPAPLPLPPPAPAPLPDPLPLPVPIPEPQSGPWSEPEPVRPHRPMVLARKIVLDDTVLHFSNGSATVSPEGVRAIREVAVSLLDYHGKYKLVVSGFTSSVGSAALNKALSHRRAAAVAQVLSHAGIPASLITSKSFGPAQPVASNATAKGQSQNRRVEIEISTPNESVRMKRLATPLVDGPATPKKPAHPHRKAHSHLLDS